MGGNSGEIAPIVAVVVVAIVAVFGIFFVSGQAFKATAQDVTGQAVSDNVADTVTGKGSTYPVNGQHYNLNIIGAKNVGDVGASDGHTMFVNLNGKTKIMMTQDLAGQFYVTDRNGLDGTASFNIAPGKYNIYARGLGKPGGKADISSWGLFQDALDGSQLILLGYVNIERAKGKSNAVNINNLFYVDVTLCTEISVDTGECTKMTVYEDYWVFDIAELLDYWWEYDNTGLKLLQVRFYSCTLDATGTASDYCRWGDGSPIVSTKTVLTP
jgi:hypothetical protein